MLLLLSACLSLTADRELGPLYDADADGIQDLLVSAPTGAGGRGSAWLIPEDRVPVPLLWEGGVQDAFWAGDNTGDGRSELVLRSGSTLTRVSRGQTGALSQLSQGPGNEVWAADVRGDGVWDLVVMGPEGLFLCPDGDLSRQDPVARLDGLLAVQVGDLDKDGDWELVTLVLNQGPDGVRTELRVYPGSRSGFEDPLVYSLPDGVLPAYLRVLDVGLKKRIVVGMSPVRTFGLDNGKLRPEGGFELLDAGGRDLLVWGERSVFHQGERLVASDGELLISGQGLGRPLLRDLEGDGVLELVVGERGQSQVHILRASGEVTVVEGPKESVSYPTGQIAVVEGQTVVFWQGRAFDARGERAAPQTLPAVKNGRVATEWGDLSWAPDGTVTWHSVDGDVPALFETGAALSIDVVGRQGAVLGVEHGLLRSFRFEMGPEGPGLAKSEPPPSGGPSWFGAQVR